MSKPLKEYDFVSKDPSEVTEVVNVVTSGNLPIELDLDGLADVLCRELDLEKYYKDIDSEADDIGEEYHSDFYHSEDIEENVKKYKLEKPHLWEMKENQPGLYYVVENQKGPLITFYESGSYIIRSNDENADSLNQKLLEQLVDIGVLDNIPSDNEVNLSTENIVVVGNVREKIRLGKVYQKLKQFTDAREIQYDSEQFPAVLFNDIENDCTVLIFTSGKLTLTGASDINSAYRTIEKIQNGFAADPMSI